MPHGGSERKYDREAVFAEIVRRIREGESLRSVCRDDGFPSPGTFGQWIDEDETGTWAGQYARAMQARADSVFDEMFEIADSVETEADVQRAKLRVDVRKWAAARMAPKKYGEKYAMDVGGGLNVDVGDKLAALMGEIATARTRVTDE